jgi:amino acid transporter
MSAIFFNGQYLQPTTLLEGMQPVLFTLSRAAIRVGVIVISLLMALLGMSALRDTEPKAEFYPRLRRIALLSVMMLVAAVVMLAVIAIPLEESTRVPLTLFEALFYIAVAIAAGIITMIVATSVNLYRLFSLTIDRFME